MSAIDPSLLERDGLGRHLGISYDEVTTERVTATMPVTDHHKQPFGLLHGGANLALAEAVASLGALVNCVDGTVPVGMELNANHLRPVRGGVVTATARPIHRGRSTQVWGIEIHDEAQRLTCVARCTLSVIAAS